MTKGMRWFIIAMIALGMACLIMCACCTSAHAEEMVGEVPADFFTWEDLGSYLGAALLVALVTQLTKELPYINKIPTQVWSYVLSVAILIASLAFTGKLTAASACLTLANGVVVSLASNGGYSLITRVKTAEQKE